MRVAVVNLGAIVSGDWRAPFVEGDALVAADGILEAVGEVPPAALDACEVVIDAGGATAIPGLIDSQVHVTFGDFTPRQNTVGYLTSYVHGGTTTAISASEVHVPGRPKDPAGVKALAVAAFKCFEHYRPGGMRVHGGSIILEPGLTRADFDDVHRDGVWLAKAGFGAVETARDYVALVRHAREAGLLTTLHTGGASIPGSFPITGADLIAIDPTVSFHINGGPVAIEDRYFEQVAAETGIAMQVCTAGNLRTTLLCAEMARKHDAFDRFLIATDTPTGSGVMPLGMIYTMVHIASLAGFDPTWMIAASTGNVAEIYGLNSGFLRPGRDADVVIVDAPLGATKPDALSTMSNGDPVAIGAVITDGIPASSAAAATPRRPRARSPSPAARSRPSTCRRVVHRRLAKGVNRLHVAACGVGQDGVIGGEQGGAVVAGGCDDETIHRIGVERARQSDTLDGDRGFDR